MAKTMYMLFAENKTLVSRTPDLSHDPDPDPKLRFIHCCPHTKTLIMRDNDRMPQSTGTGPQETAVNDLLACLLA